MKKRNFLFVAMALVASSVAGNNTSTVVKEVSQAVVLNTDVDYHITSTTPFTATGSIDITNTNHAVVIFDNLKPSIAVNQLGFVTINGEAAKNNVNCQVRIYNGGAMILPYTNTKVLTVFSEKGLKGDSCNNFGLGNTGGYMNTLTAAQLNNKIQSFRLKRGYMVTFSLKAGGRGYSRCFIAAYNDLEVDLPVLMRNRISSYRIFKWNDTSKKGLANATNSEYNSALNTQWCYSFGAGEDTGMDRECVPHKIKGSWPSTTGIGQLTYSPHMKTSNEPANSSDDTPETVTTVLGYWEDLMATGMRLCSPSQHDGGLSWTRAFMDSIDARGWRCDIVDIHCYWPSWNLLNAVDGYYTSYHRPIWISEWLWGASWNKNGVFAASDPDNDNANVLKQVLAKWNSSKYVERYAYWNSESKGHLYDSGGITESGKVYRDAEPSLGYNADIQFVPNAPRLTNPEITSFSFSPNTMVAKLKLKDTNGDLLDSLFLERKRNDGEWERLYSCEISDANSTTYSLNDTLSMGGRYLYRVHGVSYEGVDIYSAEQGNILNSSASLGNGEVQYGTFTASNTDLSYTFVDAPFADNEPAVVFGSVSNTQTKAALTERLVKTYKQKNNYNFFRAGLRAWSDYENDDFYTTGSDFSSFIIAKNGTGTIGTLAYESQVIDEIIAGDEVEVTFTKPFATVPVVMATPQYNNDNYNTVIARVYDVTTTGCKVKLMCQKSIMDAATSSVAGRAIIDVFAIEQGKTNDGNGKQVIAKTLEYTFKSGNLTKVADYDEMLKNPVLLVQMQSKNRDVAAVLRTRPNIVDSLALRLRYQVDTSDSGNSTVNASNPVVETIGYIAISDDVNYDGIVGVKSEEQKRKSAGIYDLSGRKINATNGSLPKGIYIKDGKKIIVR